MEGQVEEIPRFLNADYIDVIVKKIEKTDKVKVEKFEFKPATEKGNHYSSVILRIVVDYVVESENYKQISFILKTTFDEKYDEDETLKFVKDFDVQSREMEMYDKVLDEFHKLLRSINDDTVFSAHKYWIDNTNRALIFEDLMVRKYKCVNRVERMDVAHAKLALTKLAKYHATSIIFKQKNPQAYANIDKCFFSREHKGDAREFCFRQFDGLLDLVSNLEGYEYYAEKLIKLKDLLLERGIELYTPQESGFNVLLHGDLWSNNMMFRYDGDNNPVDVIFVDFQLPQWITPAIDIIYFIHTSIKEHLRFSKQNELVQLYYYALKETLIDGYKYTGYFPTLHEFQIIILKSSLQVLISALIVQPLIILDEKIESDMFLLMSKDEAGMKFIHDMYHGPNTVEVVKNVLPVLDALGILD